MDKDAEIARLKAALEVERAACDEWRRCAEKPDVDEDLFVYGETLDMLCEKHNARRSAERAAQENDR